MTANIQIVNLPLDPGFVLRSAFAQPKEGLVVVVDNYPVSSKRRVNGLRPETRVLHLDGEFHIKNSLSIPQLFDSSHVRVGPSGHAAIVFGYSVRSNAFERVRSVRSEVIYVFNEKGDMIRRLPIGGNGNEISSATYVTQEGQVWIKTQTESSFAAGSSNYNNNAPLEPWSPGNPSEGPGRDILLTRISAVTGEHHSYRVGTDGQDLSSGGRLVNGEEVFLLHGNSELNKPILVNGNQVRFQNSRTRGVDSYFIPFTASGAEQGFYADPKGQQTYVKSIPIDNLFRDPVTGISYSLTRRVDTSATSHDEAIGSFYVPKSDDLESLQLEKISGGNGNTSDGIYNLLDEFYESTPHRFKLHETQYELSGAGGLSANSYGNYFIVGDLKSVPGSDLMTGLDLLSVKFNSYLRSDHVITPSWSGNIRINLEKTGSNSDSVIQAKRVQNGEHASGWVGSIVTGTSMDDIIRGLNGFDQLFGKRGDDLIHGGIGRDVIDGGSGSDELHGDFGPNTYKDQEDGSKDLIAIKSDQHLTNFLYGKAGNSPNGEKADFIEGLDATDEIKIIGVATKDLSFKDAITAKGVSGIGIYAKGTLEAVYSGENLSLGEISQMTSGDASEAAIANQMWSYWGDNTIPALLN